MLSKFIEIISYNNPQLFRELKGRLKPRNLTITAVISLIGQLFLYLFYQSSLPHLENAILGQRITIYNRYCTGYDKDNWHSYQCLTDNFGNLIINKELWSLDFFLCLTIIAIFALLVAGSYLLIADLSKEEQRGTLGFIRLSPQSVSTIVTGKMLGVPSLVYFAVLLAFPLQIATGIGAKIPLSLILGFDILVITSCAFFYSLALLFAFITTGLVGFQAWLGSGAMLFFLCITTAVAISSELPAQSTLDWLMLLYPGTSLSYLVDATPLAQTLIPAFDNMSLIARLECFEASHLKTMTWFFLPLWQVNWLGMMVMMVHYGVGTYWCYQGLKRRFYNPGATVISKGQSYWLTAIITLIWLGLAVQLQLYYENKVYHLNQNIQILSILYLFWGLILIFGLSPHRQDLQDWARYRHQTPKAQGQSWRDLLISEKSPAIVVIALNLAVACLVILPVILLLPLDRYKTGICFGFVLTSGILLVCSAIAQNLLLIKTSKRLIYATASVGAIVFVPLILLAIFSSKVSSMPHLWLLSAFPIFGTESLALKPIIFCLIGQILAFSASNIYLHKQLQKAGESASKALSQWERGV